MRKPILALVLSFVFLSISSIAFGASSSLVIRPNGDAGNQWTRTCTGCTYNYQAVDEVTADTLDRLSATQLFRSDYWTMEDVSGTILAGAVIDSVVLTEYGRDSSGTQGRTACLQIGEDITSGTQRTNTAWTTYNEKLAAPGGRTWTRDNLDSLVAGIQKTAGTLRVHTAQAYVTVYYSTSPITNSAGLGADRAGVGTITWATPTNIYTSNDAYATAAAGTSHYLQASNFGFNIGLDQQIDGIKVQIEKSTTCFTGDTKIPTSTGWKFIKDLKVGDEVLGFEKEEIVIGEVLETREHDVSEYLLIRTKSHSVKTTSQHPFYTPKGLVNAGNLKTGDELLLFGNKIEKVISQEIIKEKVKVYDITVSKYHNYFANGFAVHNKTPDVVDNRVSIVKASNSIGDTNYYEEMAQWPTTDAYSTYGGATSKWGETWTPDSINDADFGVVISAIVGTGNSARVDHIRITVYYSPLVVSGVDTTSVNVTSVNLKCNKLIDTNYKRYKVKYLAGATAPDSQNQSDAIYGDASTADNDTVFTISNLTANTQYSFSVFAKNADSTIWLKKGSGSSKTVTTDAISLSISASPTTWDLDTLNPSQIKTMVTGEKIKVKNTGNVAEQLSLKIDTMDTKGEWSCSNSESGQDVNKYVMSGVFRHKHQDSTVSSGNFNTGSSDDVIDTLAQWASGNTFAVGTQDTAGATVAIGDTAALWLQMKMPTTASGTKADSTRNIVIQIGCQQTP